MWTAKHANPAQLNALLHGDETSEEFQSIADHVESCPTCQSRLEELSGDEQFDDDVRSWIDDDFEPMSDVSNSEQDIEAPELQQLGPPRHPELLGRVGKYDVERLVGRGGMGVVYKGFDTELNRPVAVKVLAAHLAQCGVARQRFSREARAAAAIVHEHVVPIHTVESSGESNGGVPFLVMPFVAGESLQARVDRDGALEEKEILRIGSQAAAGLQAAHDQGVIHRDIKPGNILLQGGVERALVTDFGLAQTVDDATLTRSGVITGTPNYMSPEQAKGHPSDARSDLFSLGCVLYFMATGRPPFRAERAMGVLHRVCNEPHTPVWNVRPEMPDAVCEIIDCLLEKNAKKRSASAGEVRDRLQHALARSQTPPPKYWIALKRFARRNRKPLRQAAVAVCLAVAVVTLWGWRQSMNTDSVANRPAAKLPTVTEKAYSPFVWQQASSQEQEQWAADIDQIQWQLQHLERSNSASDGQKSTLDPWESDL